MAEVYTVTLNNETPVELTGGRVGQFLVSGGFYLGGEELGVEPVMDGLDQTGLSIVDGFSYSSDNEPFGFYVTSPDEIYGIITTWYTGQHYNEYVITVFHCR